MNPCLNMIVLTAVCASLISGFAAAQTLPPGALFPQQPTSADNIQLRGVKGFCGPYNTNAFNVSMVENNITVRLGKNPNYIYGVCPPESIDAVDLGRLPAGEYTITVTKHSVLNNAA
jgi:hypothetical protein